MVVLPDLGRGVHAVSRMEPTLENPEGFHRLIGGGVEHGETALDAVLREVCEELGATLLEPELLGVLENIFELDGEPGHEVVFVHTGRLDPADTVPAEGGMFEDGGRPMPVEWRPVDDAILSLPLHPTGAAALVRRAAQHD
ncbi:NUDIX domain-containing protein [Knoellia locipacati]|uniref:NUDIX domain-containing protein n=1 Tax=Knoellia locipacati TaxID=882824 RepID=UPI00384BF98E